MQSGQEEVKTAAVNEMDEFVTQELESARDAARRLYGKKKAQDEAADMIVWNLNELEENFTQNKMVQTALNGIDEQREKIKRWSAPPQSDFKTEDGAQIQNYIIAINSVLQELKFSHPKDKEARQNYFENLKKSHASFSAFKKFRGELWSQLRRENKTFSWQSPDRNQKLIGTINSMLEQLDGFDPQGKTERRALLNSLASLDDAEAQLSAFHNQVYVQLEKIVESQEKRLGELGLLEPEEKTLPPIKKLKTEFSKMSLETLPPGITVKVSQAGLLIVQLMPYSTQEETLGRYEKLHQLAGNLPELETWMTELNGVFSENSQIPRNEVSPVTSLLPTPSKAAQTWQKKLRELEREEEKTVSPELLQQKKHDAIREGSNLLHAIDKQLQIHGHLTLKTEEDKMKFAKEILQKIYDAQNKVPRANPITNLQNHLMSLDLEILKKHVDDLKAILLSVQKENAVINHFRKKIVEAGLLISQLAIHSPLEETLKRYQLIMLYLKTTDADRAATCSKLDDLIAELAVTLAKTQTRGKWKGRKHRLFWMLRWQYQLPNQEKK